MYIILFEYESVRPDVWPKNECRSLWPIFLGPVIVPNTLKTVSCMNIIIYHYELVWPDACKCRSPWPIFHTPVIFALYLEDWCMYIILSEYESVRPDIWPENKCRSLWPIFRGPLIVPYTLKTISCMNIIIWIMIQYDPLHDLKINVGHCDPYFMVQWFCLISWKIIWWIYIIVWISMTLCLTSK